jgi:hypothetical protein
LGVKFSTRIDTYNNRRRKLVLFPPLRKLQILSLPTQKKRIIMDRSKNPQVETFAPLGEPVDKMLMEQSGLFETFEIASKDLEQSLNRLKESLETLCEKLRLLEKIAPFEEKKLSL